MPAQAKVILVLIDGLSADYFRANRHRLPYLDRLAGEGLLVERVRPAIPGTSRPGRATMLTGCDGSVHGVYGNSVLGLVGFRTATEADVQSKTVARLTHQAGLDVVGLGFGMLRPEDTSAYLDPWWQHLALQGMTNLKVPTSGRSGNFAPIRKDPEGRLANALAGAPLSLGVQDTPEATLHPQMIGMASDQLMLQLAGDLAISDAPPDLILTEFSVTDAIQHWHGYESAATHWAYGSADMAIGLLHRLDAAGRRDDFVIIVSGDHGHAPIETAIYPDAIVPHGSWATEGASLHVAVHSNEDKRLIEGRCEGLDIVQLDGAHLPDAVRNRLITLVAPKGAAFERRTAGQLVNGPTGRPTVISTHGLNPTDPADHAVAIIHGGGRRGIVPQGDLQGLAPTILGLLGLDGAAGLSEPLFGGASL